MPDCASPWHRVPVPLGLNNLRCHTCGGCEQCCQCDDGEEDFAEFDADELGLDPELDAERMDTRRRGL